MHATRTVLAALLALVLAALPSATAWAQKVSVKEGNVYFTDAAGHTAQLTTSGHDSDPSLSPDRHTVVFVRGTPGKTIDTGSGTEEATEMWLIDTEGRNARMLLRGAADEKPEHVLAGLTSPQFSPDGKTVYFISSAWATSGAIHAMNAATKKEHFVCPGSDLQVVPHGEYRGDLIIAQHRYFLGGGSYDWYYLLRPDGKELGILGESPEMFNDVYVKEAK